MFKDKRSFLIGVTMLTALAFVACGGDDAAPAAAPAVPASTGPPTAASAPTTAPAPTEAPAPTIASEPTAPPAPTVVPQPSATSAPAPTEVPSSGGVDSVTLMPSKDNTLYEDVRGSLSSGAGTALFVGSTNGGSDRRALIQFEIAGAIPDGATISSVSLTMTVTKTIADTHDATLHAVSSAWGEGASSAGRGGGGGAVAEDGDATWTHAVLDGAA
jgi:hypothetical protein